MKELFYKFVKRDRYIVVDDANLARYASAIYDTLGHRGDTITFDRVWRIGGLEWLLRYKATDAQCDEINRRMSRS